MVSPRRKTIWGLLQPSQVPRKHQRLAKVLAPQHRQTQASRHLHAIPVRWEVQLRMQLLARGPNQDANTYQRRDHLSSESKLLMTLGQASSFNGWTGLLSQRSTKSSLRPSVQLWLCQLWMGLTRSNPLAPSQTSTSRFDRCPRPAHRTLGQQ
jgi:hypothetical protein